MTEPAAVTIALFVGLTAGAAGASWKLIWGWIHGAFVSTRDEAKKIEQEVKAEAKKL